MNDQSSNAPAAPRFKAHVVREQEPRPVEPAAAAETASPRPGRRKQPRPGDPATWEKEVGGPQGPEPTRYGDWERNGICSDF